MLALWSSYITVFEPAERTLYDTRTFTLKALQLIDQAPAPVVLHGMGKDAKAIKFMVNVDRDLLPAFHPVSCRADSTARTGLDRDGQKGL